MVLYSKKELPNPRKFILCGVETVIASIDYRDAAVNRLFIYCPINMASISNFCNCLMSIHQLIEADIPRLIMGDTNIDFFTQVYLSSYLERLNVRQIMHSSTRDYGSCLDHVYTVATYMSNSDIFCATLESYYSDHKPIIVYLPL